MSPITIFRIPQEPFQTHKKNNDTHHNKIILIKIKMINIYTYIYIYICMPIRDAMIIKYYHDYIHHDQWNTSLLQSNKGYLSFISYRIMRGNLSLLPKPVYKGHSGQDSPGREPTKEDEIVLYPTPEKGPVVVFQPSFLRGYASLRGSIPFHFWKVSNLQSLFITPFHHHVATSQNQI